MKISSHGEKRMKISQWFFHVCIGATLVLSSVWAKDPQKQVHGKSDPSLNYQIFGTGNKNETGPSINEREQILGTEDHTPFKHQNKNELIKHSNRLAFKRVYDKGDHSFYLTYIRDKYKITDDRGLFKKIFVDDPSSKKTGSVHLGVDKYFDRNKTNFSYGLFVGVGHYRGRGIFAGGEVSDRVKFVLWTVPIDLIFSGQIDLKEYGSLQIGIGPSSMALFQVRSDLKGGDSRKYRRQLGIGYAGVARIKISLANIFQKNFSDIFQDYNATNCYLNLTVRSQRYSSFQDDINIAGTSLGAGISFDYL